MSNEMFPGGKFRHEEGLTYGLFGTANRVTEIPRQDGSATIGLACCADGYEETGNIEENPITVYKIGEDLVFVGEPKDNFLTAIIYQQLEKGKLYPAGQLWYRKSQQNFAAHFTKIPE